MSWRADLWLRIISQRSAIENAVLGGAGAWLISWAIGISLRLKALERKVYGEDEET